MQTGENGWIPEDRQRQRKAQIWITVSCRRCSWASRSGEELLFGYLLQVDSPKAAVFCPTVLMSHPAAAAVRPYDPVCIGEPDLAEPEAVFRDAADYVKARHFSPAGSPQDPASSRSDREGV